MEQANINLKENGLARTEKRQGADWIMIKSEMIKEFVIQDILKDAEIFPTGELPMLLNQDKLDILQFLTTVLKHFDPVIIHDAYGWTQKVMNGIPRWMCPKKMYTNNNLVLLSVEHSSTNNGKLTRN